MVAGAWVVAAAWVVAGVAAFPLHTHHDVKKSYPPEAGVDEEVRQLLDLKTHLDGPAHLPATPAAAPAQAAGAAGGGGGGGAADNDKGGEVRMEKNREESFKMVDGVKDQHSHTSERVTSDGQVLRQVGNEAEMHQEPGQPQHSRQQVDLDVPEEGVHQTMMEEDGHRSLFSRDHKSLERYSPLDLALYVYRTGDEEGVTLAIQELIAEGLMSAEEALEYLHDIREHLHRLTLQDAQDKELPEEFKSLVKKNELPLTMNDMSLGGPDNMLGPDADYDAMMERMRGGVDGGVGGGVGGGSQDYAYTQYSLEEVIYQLAKILFKQAMHREGDVGSERALQEVAGLLEKEVARGAISPEVEKKVLDVMVNSLVDSLGENEFPSAPGPVIGGSNFRLANEGAFPMSASSMIGGSSFKPSSDLFQLPKATTKREAPEEQKDEEKKV